MPNFLDPLTFGVFVEICAIMNFDDDAWMCDDVEGCWQDVFSEIVI